MNWRAATKGDIEWLVELSNGYQEEMAPFVTISKPVYAQFLNERIDTLGWVNAVVPGEAFFAAEITKLPYSDDLVLMGNIFHTAKNLSPRRAVALTKEKIDLHELSGRHFGCKALFDSTIRTSQTPFLRLHERAGWTIKGSFAFKEISK